MIRLLVFSDGGVTFDYNEEGLKRLNSKKIKLESLFGTVSDEDALKKAFELYPKKTDKEIISILQKGVFPYAYKEIIPDFFNSIRKKYPNIEIAIATEHSKYIDVYLKKYVDNYYISNVIGLNKSDKRFFETIINQSGILPREILYIDFDEANVEMANRCGISSIKVEQNSLDLIEVTEKNIIGHNLIDTLNSINKK